MREEILVGYVERGLLQYQVHPEYPNLKIYNYTPKTQYEKLWDDVTLVCRGLVMDGDVVVARPFGKFFNFSEHNPDEIPNTSFEVFEKMDGSLGILFYYDNKWILSSRGSFTSEQAVRAKEMMDSLNLYDSLNPEYTYMFEIIYATNRIVCKYNFEDLVLLGAIRTKDAKELPYSDLPKGFTIVKRYENKTLEELFCTSNIEENREGYTIRFSNGFRIKVKSDWYVRMHRILTNVTNVTIWEYLKDNLPFDEILDRVPDEFYNSVRNVKEKLTADYLEIEKAAVDAYNVIKPLCEDRKTFALKAISDYPDVKHILFKMMDGKDYSQAIWDMVRPDFQRLAF